MKKYLFVVFIFGISMANVLGQTALSMEKETMRKIEVTGTAELEVVPDEIYFSISLREYFKDEKNQRDKTTLETLEKQLIEAIKAAGMPRENLSISGMSGYREWNGRKKPQFFLASKQYQLKLSNLTNINDLMAKVDDRGVEYVNVARVEHSKKEQFKKEIKINALKAAKEKAAYLLESVGSTLGEVVEIRELEEGYYAPMVAQYANVRMMKDQAGGGATEPSLEYEKIKFSYRMQAVFRIK
jgi:uncharacterized protein